MYSNPNETYLKQHYILAEQFRLKGYSCKEVKEAHSTVLILTHERSLIVQHPEVLKKIKN